VGSDCWRHWEPGQKLGRRDMTTTISKDYSTAKLDKIRLD
jgi:hypothetical protein